MVDTLADGLAEGRALGDRLLAVTAADPDAVDDVTLLGLPDTINDLGSLPRVRIRTL